MSKKILLLIILITLFCLAAPVLATSSLGESLNKTAEQADINQKQNLTEIAATVVQALLALLGLIFVVLIIYSGATWMTAMGDAKKVEKAKNIIKAAVIGLLIVIASYSIAYFITSRLEATTTPSAGDAGAAMDNPTIE